MNVLERFLYFSLLFIFILNSVHSDSTNQTDICQETVKYINCKNETKKIYTNQNAKIVAELKRCPNKEYTFNYNIINSETGESIDKLKNPSGPILFLNKFSLKRGIYKIVLHVETKDMSVFVDKCNLTVEAAPPIPVIQGGFQRFIGKGVDLILNASGCIDFNSETPTDSKNFKYNWTYTCDDCAGSITAKEDIDLLVIPGTKHNKEMNYTVNLGITTKSWSDMQFTQQTVYVRENTPSIEIRCVQNCNPPFKEGNLILLAICTYECPKENYLWKWKIYEVPQKNEDILSGQAKWKFKFSKEKNTTNVIEFREKSKSFVSGRYYLATVSLNEFSNATASYKFHVQNATQFDCFIEPEEGYISETKFHFNCKGEDSSTYFWVSLASQDGKEQVLQYDSSWEYLSFIIPREGNIHLRFTDYSGVEGYLDFTLNVDFQLHEMKKKPEEIFNSYFNDTDSVKKLLEEQDYTKALDKMTSISKNIANMNSSKFPEVEPIAEELLNDLEKLPLKDMLSIENAISIVDDLTNIPVTFSPQFSLSATSLCQKLASDYEKNFKLDHSSQTMSNMPVLTTVSKLMQCTSSGNRENLPAIRLEDASVNMTTVTYVTDEGEMNTEVYDEYKDETEAVHNIEKYKNVTNNFIDVCLMNGEVISKLLTNSETKIQETISFKNYFIAVKKTHGFKMADSPMLVSGVKLDFSKDILSSEEMFSVVMCVTSENIFWWQKTVEISSDILTITVSSGDRIKTQFDKPFGIIFTQRRQPSVKYPPMVSSENSKYSLIEPDHINDEQVSIYLVAIEAGQSFKVEFLDVNENLKLNVISTTFRLPLLKDFAGGIQTITKHRRYYISENVYDYATFRLFAVKPRVHEKITKDQLSFQFKMNAFDVTCVKWLEANKSWITGCKALFLKVHSISCQCKTLSTISTVLNNIPIKKWQEYIPLPVYLVEQNCYLLCSALLVTFLIYSIAICFAVKETDNILKAVYFLSDVVRDNRYAYIIITKTSIRLGSGTTSNVMVKLKGSKGESEAHVLNYPDPLMLMLQRCNENWFVLATRFNIGTLVEIEIWIDGVGASPTWSCNRIDVFDLQHRNWYNFRISQIFSIYPKPNIYLKSTPLIESKERTSFRVIIDLLSKCLPNFQMFNLSLRQTEETLPYFKKLTLMLSIFSSITVWGIIINGFPVRNATDSIMDKCDYTITTTNLISGIGASLTTAIYEIPIKYFFITSKVQLPWHAFLQKTKKPVICTVICWLLTTTIICFNFTFIVVFGIWVPHKKTLLLLTDIGIGILFYVLVVDAFCHCVINLVHGEVEITNYLQRSYRMVIDDIENQRKVLYRVFGKYLLRPFLQHLYTPIQGMALKLLWHTEKIKNEVRELIQNVVMFLIYVSLMYMVVLANRDYRSVYSNEQVNNLITGRSTRSFPFEEVTSPKTLDSYIKETLIEATQSKIWYGTYAVNNPGMTVDYCNKLIGVIRLRQHRSKQNSCDVLEQMRFLNTSCNADYFMSQSEDDYGEKWQGVPQTIGRMKDIWRFSAKNYTGSSVYIGKLGIYPGGGYVAYLGRGLKNSLINHEYLEDQSWIDDMTRSVFIEFLLYDVNFNIFNAIQLTIEKSNLGYLKKEVTVETSKMLLLDNETIIAFPVLLGLFTFLVLVISARTVMRIKRTGVWYFKDIWHLIDLFLIVLSVVCVAIFFKRSSELGTLLLSLEGKDPKDFVNYFGLLEADSTFTVICAILISIATIKLWGLFRFMIIFRVVEKTFITSFLPLCALFFYNVILILAFACFGFLLFVDHSYRFEGYFNTVEFLILLNLRPFEGEEIEMLDEPKLGFGYVFYVSYALVVKFFSCVYTALIMIYYAKSQEYYSNYSEVYSVSDYCKNQFFFYCNLLKGRWKALRLRAGKNFFEYTVPVTPKADEVRYAESTTVNVDKMRAMSLISLCVIRNSSSNRKPLTQKDIRIMTYALYYLKKINQISEDEEEIERFYKGHVGGNKIKLIHEMIFQKLEAATNLILGRTASEVFQKTDTKSVKLIMKENIAQMKRMTNHLSIMVETIKKIRWKMVSVKQ